MVAPEQGDVIGVGGGAGNSAERDLLRVLVDNKVISQAQADLVQNDHQATGMNVEEILLARRWVSEETLGNLAPWLQEESSDKNTDGGGSARTGSYEENLKKYRLILAEILGESSE